MNNVESLKYYIDNSQQNCHKIRLLGILEREKNFPVSRRHEVLSYEWDIIIDISSKNRTNIYQNDLQFIFYSTVSKFMIKMI